MSRALFAVLLFVSVSLQAALYFDASPYTYAVSSQPTSLAVADFNADGAPDVVTAHLSGSPLRVLTNDGVGRFSHATNIGNLPSGAVFARDINGDGDPDLVALGGLNSGFVTLTNYRGTFSLVSTTAITGVVSKSGLAFGDLDMDGWEEIMTVNGSAVMVFTNDHRGAFTHKQTIFLGGFYPTALTAGNFDGRGGIDLVVTHTEDTAMFVTNNGAGQLVLGARISSLVGPVVPRAADVNNDGLLDCLFDTALYTNTGLGTLVLANSNVVGGLNALAAVGDLNGDGWPEVIGKNDNGLLYIRTNNHANTFTTVAQPFFTSGNMDAAITDANTDGALDITAAVQWDNEVQVLFQHPRLSLSIHRTAPGQAVVSWPWTAPARNVQSAPTVTGPWSPRTPALNGPARRLEIATPTSQPAEFFRFAP